MSLQDWVTREDMLEFTRTQLEFEQRIRQEMTQMKREIIREVLDAVASARADEAPSPYRTDCTELVCPSCQYTMDVEVR